MELDAATRILTNVIKRSPVDIQFNNLSYSIEKKTILQSINGQFSAGHLTGILGSSGAGKTTLLNVLAGQLQKGVSGQIYINDEPRNIKKFHKMSSYIMQEDVVQPFLTVMESMTVAANLKLGNEFSAQDKEAAVLEVLSLIGLESCRNTRVERLSGGERKRFIIALEMVNNPPVIFLDEPTTGLDDVAVRQCIKVLKSLTSQGRTIICTIHQPSDSLLKLFDTVYFMSDGYCIYNGTVLDLIPFLSDVGYPCPTNYNPADYIIEIVHSLSASKMVLKDKIMNGAQQYSSYFKSDIAKINSIDEECYQGYSGLNEFSTSFWTQFTVLINRSFLQMRRNWLILILQFGYNIMCGLMVGLMFFQVGNKGSEILLNVKCFYGLVVYFMFTHVMSPILIYPFEIKLLQREYFNRWYSLKAYFTALIVGLLPVIVATTIIFSILAYTLTGQPLEWHRFWWFTLICVLMAVASQKMGYIIGTIFDPAKGACVGSAVSIPLVLLGMYGIGHGETIEPYMRVLMSLSFPYHAYVGISTSILNDRGPIECDAIICYFGDPNFVLEKMGFAGRDSFEAAIYLIIFTIVHQLLSYIFLRIRIAPEYTLFRNFLKS